MTIKGRIQEAREMFDFYMEYSKGNTEYSYNETCGYIRTQYMNENGIFLFCSIPENIRRKARIITNLAIK